MSVSALNECRDRGRFVLNLISSQLNIFLNDIYCEGGGDMNSVTFLAILHAIKLDKTRVGKIDSRDQPI